MGNKSKLVSGSLIAGFFLLGLNPIAFAEESQSSPTFKSLLRDAMKTATLGKNDEAIASFKKAIEEAEIQEDAALKAKQLGMALTALSGFYCQKEMYTEAEPLLKRALEVIEGAEKTDKFSLVAVLYNFGGFYSSRKEYDTAISNLERAFTITSGDEKLSQVWAPRILISLAQVHTRAGDEASTLKSIMRYADLMPKNYNTVNRLNAWSAEYIERGKLAQAEPILVKSLETLDLIGTKDSSSKDAKDEQSSNRAIFHNHLMNLTISNLAEVYYGESKLVKAEALCTRLVQLNDDSTVANMPRLQQALFRLAYFYSEQKNYAKAESNYRRSIKISKQYSSDKLADPYLLEGLSKVLKAMHKEVDAAQLALQAQEIRKKRRSKRDSSAKVSEGSSSKAKDAAPNKSEDGAGGDQKKIAGDEIADRLRKQALSFFAQRQYSQALEKLNQAVKLAPKNLKVLYARALTLDMLKRYREAIKDYTTMIDLGAPDAELYNNRGLDYDYIGDYKNALKDLNEAITRKPDYACAIFNRGRVFARHIKDYDKAIEDFSKAIKITPRWGIAYRYRATCYDFQGEFKLAARDLGKAIEFSPPDSHLHELRALDFYMLKKIDQAIDEFSKAIELDPKAFRSYAGRCNSYMYKKQYEKALTDCQKSLQINPKQTYAYFMRADLHYRLNKLDQAAVDIDKYIDLKPKDIWAYILRSAVNCRLEKLKDAEADAAKAIESSSTNYMGYCRLGQVLLKLGKSEQALAAFNKAASLDMSKGNSDDGELYWSRAQAYEKLEKHELASKDRLEAKKRGYRGSAK